MGAEHSDMVNEINELITVVIPTKNEEEAIGKVIKELRELGFENILVVDANSTDRTREIAGSLGAKVILQVGPGKPGAIRTAIEKVNTPYMVVMDGDYTYDPSYIKDMLKVALEGGFDEVIGARSSGKGNMPLLHRLGNWFINKTFKYALGRPVTDVCSGMYLLRTSFAKRLNIFTESFDVEVEIAAQAALTGSLAEVPISYRPRIGRSKLSLKDGLKIIRTILWMATVYNPAMLYSFIMALTGIPAIAILAWVVYEQITKGIWHSGFALFGVMLFLFSAQAWAIVVISMLITRVQNILLDHLRREGARREYLSGH